MKKCNKNTEIKEKKKEKKPTKWIVSITIITFCTSSILSFAANRISEALNLYFAGLVLLFMIFIGIIFDIVGIAVTAADEVPFHALAAKKKKGAKSAIKLIRNAEKVSNICNDVVGDIAGIISGSTSAIIVVYIINMIKASNDVIASVVVTSVVAALTVGGKAYGKTIAMKHSNSIMYFCAKILNIFGFGK